MPKKVLPAPSEVLARFSGADPSLVLLNTEEQAILLKTAPGTLENMRSRGEGPPYIKIGRSAVRYRLSHTLRFLEQMTHGQDD